MSLWHRSSGRANSPLGSHWGRPAPVWGTGRPRVRQVARLSLGGAIWGILAGTFLGTFFGVVYGAFVGDVSVGLDGAVLGCVGLMLGGGLYGLVLGVTGEPEHTEGKTAQAAPPEAQPAAAQGRCRSD